MRISPVNNFTTNFAKAPSTQRQTFATQPADSFQRVSFGALEAPKTPEQKILESKIGAAFQHCGTNDVVLVAKDLNSGVDDLFGNIERFPKIIENIYLVEDQNVNSSFTLQKSNLGLKTISNIGKGSFILDAQSKENETLLMPGDAKMFVGRQSFTMPGAKFEIANRPERTTDTLESLGVKRFNFMTPDMEKLANYTNSKNVIGLLDNDNKTTLKNIKRITFDSVGGQEGAIRTLKESVLAPLMYADAFKDDNFDRGVILHGPPGTGKTLLARALANETSAHFIHISANDLTTKWLGETEQHWREMFEEARAHQPAIIFVDEFDAITQNRDGGGTEIYNTTVNQILTLMSSLEADNARVVVVAATNRLDAIDPAMKRSGRFGSQVEVKAPDLKGCKDILQIHTKDRSIDPEFNYDEYAAKLHKAGATGADIAKIAAEAKKTMFRREGIYEKMFNKTFEEYDLYGKFITKEDFDKAYDETFKNNKPKKPIGFTS